jgi:hypothetical protein
METNMRLKLALEIAPHHPELLDVQLTSYHQHAVKFDPKYGFGMFQPERYGLNSHVSSNKHGGGGGGGASIFFLDTAAQSKYRFLVHIDGNVGAHRLLTSLATGSVVFRVKSRFVSWIDHILQPGYHFVEVASDLSDLVDLLRLWNTPEYASSCREISRNAREFAITLLLRSTNTTSTNDAGRLEEADGSMDRGSPRGSCSTPSSQSSSSSFFDIYVRHLFSTVHQICTMNTATHSHNIHSTPPTTTTNEYAAAVPTDDAPSKKRKATPDGGPAPSTPAIVYDPRRSSHYDRIQMMAALRK